MSSAFFNSHNSHLVYTMSEFIDYGLFDWDIVIILTFFLCSVLAGGMLAIDSSGEALWKMHNSGVCSYSFSSPHPTTSVFSTRCKEKLRVLSLGASLLGFSLGTLYIKVSNKVDKAYLSWKYE